MGEPSPQSSQRFDKLEELQSFADRRADELGEQVAALERVLRGVEGRLRQLEQRLGQLGERVELIPLPPRSDDPGATGPSADEQGD